MLRFEKLTFLSHQELEQDPTGCFHIQRIQVQFFCHFLEGIKY